MFVTSELDEPAPQEALALEAPEEGFLGTFAPNIYFYTSERHKITMGPEIEIRVMRDFVGLESSDPTIRDAILDFSYHVAVGHMEEAFKVIKQIPNAAVWESMAGMCVKTKRLDVLPTCLANMGNARACRALREVMKFFVTIFFELVLQAQEENMESDAQIGIVAIELGMFELAEKLFVESGRHDLLNQLCQARNDWTRALDIANKADRIHLRSTHFQYAQYLETIGDISGAIKHFESAEAHRTEVPRLFHESNRMDELEKYVNHLNDRQLAAWWARFAESKGNYEKALKYYRMAEDYFSLVRVYCFQDDIESVSRRGPLVLIQLKFSLQAEKVVAETNDIAASYELGRTLENMERVQEAIHYYSKAQCFNHGIRLALQMNLDTEVMNMALQTSGKSHLMLNCAK